MIDPSLVAILAATAAPLLGFLAIIRRFSGRIESSAAADLWAESRSIRDWSTARLTHLEERVAYLEGANSSLNRERDLLVGQLAHRDDTIVDLRRQIEGLLARVDGLDGQHG